MNLTPYFLAIDLGASSGRHILGYIEDGVFKTEIVHSFGNRTIDKDGTVCWDIDYLFAEIVSGIKKCADIGKIPHSISIDTWGVDFALLDSEDKLLGSCVAYRDARTKGMDDAVFAKIPAEELYKKTGIISNEFNTIYQLMALQKREPELLKKAKTLLLMPEYLSFLLTGIKKAEYTIASTTGLVDIDSKNWCDDIINTLDLPRDIFLPLNQPGTVVGQLSQDIQQTVGYNTKIILGASHDTASAVVATPFTNSKNKLFLSSGTWSLLGVESVVSSTAQKAMKLGFSNEGGYGGTIRFLKNIMGLWMVQSVKKELDAASGSEISFSELDKMATEADISSTVNCNDTRFFAPASMIDEIQNACKESGQQVPKTPGELAKVVYHSLAICYRDTIKELEELFGQKFDHVHIIGGGSQSKYLNGITAQIAGKPVLAGPIEATAIGNLTVQMLGHGIFNNLTDARACIRKSFEATEY